ncbi:hypothetical protein FNF28_03682 [Cafeteria roenbergensis]|uniref:Small nuclear ribonucleoprotein Prp3 C-terminal domain-containing protein n=1 Tax=Cafeteria roenbergensis TaxID=33653 RepID=A0A5A8DHB9_CAFRO|nr:hypothetical protein FNF28_03682 [Cafeteria roenbergensis]
MIVSVTVHGAIFSVADQERIQDAATAVAEEMAGGEAMWAVASAAQDAARALEAPAAAAAAAAAGSGTPASLSPGSVPAADGAMGTRVWIWFHHIKNPAKKKAICDWAKELGLVGVCKPGYPGVLIAQGSESACKEYTSRLRALRWKAMAVRAEEPLNRGVAEAEAEFAAALAGCGSAFAGHVRGVALLGEQDLGLAASLFDRLGCGGTFRRVILKMSSERDPEPGDELGGADSS